MGKRLPVFEEGRDEARDPHTRRGRRNYARWRAITLSLVYVVFAIHIAHWRAAGKTLAPLELNEVMYTLELGIITAGFLFMCALVLGTLIFGRFFCSWACHIMVLQDFCAWMLRKLGIRAKPIRSRLLLWVPPLTAIYMFVWPQIVRAWHSRAFPSFYFATDRDGWASFVTDNFWRNLPGPWIITLTFLVCGFAIVYLLGSRTFCTYVCPYGAIFGLADRFAPGKIRVNDSCQQCGRCTAACTSGIRVHEEVNKHGMVVNPACLKDLDCVSVCPQQALRYGFGRPGLFKSITGGGRFGIPYEFSLAEELVAAFIFIAVLLSFRGLYGRIPFLLSLAMGIIAGYLTVQAMRLASRPAVRLSNISLKQTGHVTGAGWSFVACFITLAAFIGHSAFIRYHEFTGLKQAITIRSLEPATRRPLASSATRHLLTADQWGLIVNPRVERALITTATELGDFATVKRFAMRNLESNPLDGGIRLTLGRAYLNLNAEDEATAQFDWIISRTAYATAEQMEIVAAANAELASMAGRRGDFPAVVRYLRAAVAQRPSESDLHARLGSALAETGDIAGAIRSLEQAVLLNPQTPGAQYNLGTLLAHAGRLDEAILCYELALADIPDDGDLLNNYGSALLRLSRYAEAEPPLRRAIAVDPQHADAHFNLGMVLWEQQRLQDATSHLESAARLDSRYASLLQQGR